MGQGQGGQRQMLLGGSQGGGVQTQVAADEEGQGAGGLFPLGEPGREGFRGILPALGGEGHHPGPGRDVGAETLAFPGLEGFGGEPGCFFFRPDAGEGEVQEGLQALLIEGEALLNEFLPGLAHHEDGYGEHRGHRGRDSRLFFIVEEKATLARGDAGAVSQTEDLTFGQPAAAV